MMSDRTFRAIADMVWLVNFLGWICLRVFLHGSCPIIFVESSTCVNVSPGDLEMATSLPENLSSRL